MIEQQTDESLNVQALPEQTDAELEAREAEFQILEARALELWRADQNSATELGKALIAVRESLRHIHGAFTTWYENNELDENRVHYCIRKVEGKIKPAQPRPEEKQDGVVLPDPDFVLNEHNLAVAQFASAQTGKYTVNRVLVDAEGTTAVDRSCLVKVSLPPNQPQATNQSATLSRDMMLRAARQVAAAKRDAPTGEAGLCQVAIGRERAVLTAFDTCVQGASQDGPFPNCEKVKKVIANFGEAQAEMGIGDNLGRLIQLLNFVNTFGAREKIKISVLALGLRIEATNEEGQKFFALLTCDTSSKPPAVEQQALPPAPETEVASE